uniref:U3 small nucleolar RNA-associated protein 14,U3 small nucleolar RNA-associated protein 14 n=1 Tax=Saccharomyces cerevisiae (strain ATCC 204508 / S288c) TaxID=559292 RepID=UPI00167C4572|nr:Chain UN, U3 small nucleolar RNA-associated protein 14,U3 small nucleolar RNA-associated protein 14 [Saccharomyces cerevisiae S288C]
QRIQQRHDRKAAYEISRQEVSKWNDIVQQNRRADHLIFPLNKPTEHNHASAFTRTQDVPQTELQEKVDQVLQESQNVIINEKVNKKNLKYQSSAVPFPFENREQYERSLRMPIGQEWTSRASHQELIKPRIMTKPGQVIDPLKAP